MKTVIIVIAVMLGVGLVLCGGGAFMAKGWWDENGETMMKEGKRVHAEATAFAATHAQEECVGEGIKRLNCPKDQNFTAQALCNGMASVFLDTCLKAATPSPKFCDGVPLGFSPLKQAEFANGVCGKYERAEDQTCTQMIAKAIPQFCMKSAQPASAPAGKK